MKNKEDWLIQATSAKNVSIGSSFTLKLKGHPWQSYHQAQLALEDVIKGLKILEALKAYCIFGEGLTTHQVRDLIEQ